MSFTKPTDVRQWWCAPHCGPGTTDSQSECECGKSRFDCALTTTQAIKAGTAKESSDGPDPDNLCWCSGFWCPACGRFWAQNGCHENYGAEYDAADGAKLKADGNKVSCHCGQYLFEQVNGPEDDE